MKQEPEQPDTLAQECAQLIYAAFRGYNQDFSTITRLAARTFADRDWHLAHEHAVQRIELYELWVNRTVERLDALLRQRRTELLLWRSIKQRFASIISGNVDRAFPKTFFSSITRRLFDTKGVNPSIEFVAVDAPPDTGIADQADKRAYQLGGAWIVPLSRLLQDYFPALPFEDLQADAGYICSKISEAIGSADGAAAANESVSIETIKEIFYQGSRAYIVGRIVRAAEVRPLILALSHKQGLRVEAALVQENEASILFGFARSYFHVDLKAVADVVAFLRSILPRKPISELYTILGRSKQGKTERFRSFFHHFANSSDQFTHAAGQRGMVMAVFTLPSYDIVFKVIRDKFQYPKNISRKEVVERYQLVFKHDRVGRLIDAQEYKRLRFPSNRFEPSLLEELLAEASMACKIVDSDLVIEHCYVERRMVPLDLYLAKADPLAAELAVIDYGQAITDLARSNIFPGDLLLKNFGISRHGRVIFYDYDELCLLGDCNFRKLPEPATTEQEMSAEAWFYVGEDDIFPEQFGAFLGLGPDLFQVFKRHHQHLLQADFWHNVQARTRAGEILTVLPYRPRPRD